MICHSHGRTDVQTKAGLVQNEVDFRSIRVQHCCPLSRLCLVRRAIRTPRSKAERKGPLPIWIPLPLEGISFEVQLQPVSFGLLDVTLSRRLGWSGLVCVLPLANPCLFFYACLPASHKLNFACFFFPHTVCLEENFLLKSLPFSSL